MYGSGSFLTISRIDHKSNKNDAIDRIVGYFESFSVYSLAFSLVTIVSFVMINDIKPERDGDESIRK